MQGHEFENNVHKQMGDFRVSPSEDVWSRVEKELRKDKKRRRLLLPLLLLVGLLGYWLIQQSGQSSVSIAEKQVNYNNKSTSADSIFDVVPGTTRELQNASKRNDIKPGQTEPAVHSTAIGITPARPGIKETTSVVTSVKASSSVVKKSQDNNAVVITSSSELYKNKKKKESITNKGVLLSAKKPESKSVERTLAATDKEEVIPGKQIIPADKLEKAEMANDLSTSKTTTPIAVTPNALMINVPDSGSLPKDQAKKKINWQWGITANMGISRIAEGGILNTFDKSLVMDAAAYNGGVVQVPGPTGYTEPATIEPGLNWSAGFFVQHKMAKRLQVSVGLQYTYYSTQNTIGTRIDSTRLISNMSSNSVRVTGYYLNDGSDNYTSKYHFLELPVTLHVPLTKNNRTPFFWSSGLSIGQLIATNALHYDGTTGVYYKDDNLFRKTQVGLHTGLSILLFSRNKHPLDIGPQFQYKLSSLLKPTTDDARHLLSGSLLLRWYLK